jgi:Ca2+/Na+ antiporter
MKVWKLVSGILSIILFVLVIFQSCAAGLSNALEENGEVSGSAGVIVAIMLLAGGIVSIVTRKSEKKGGNIALIILFGLGAIIGFSNYGSYSDLAIWSGWCLINAVLAIVAIITGKKHKDITEENV